MSNALPATHDSLADLARSLDRAVRGDTWAARAAVDDGSIAVVVYDAHGNIERDWVLGAAVAAELVDGGHLAGRDLGAAIDCAELTVARTSAFTEPTLHRALAAVGWSSRGATGGEPVYTNGKRMIVDAGGAEVGWMTAGDTWELLRERGLLGREAA